MWNEIGQWVGGILGTAAAVAILALTQRAWVWLNANLSEQHQKMLSEAAQKVLTLGFTKLIPLIEKEGWNSDKVREAVLQFGVDEIKVKFPDVFKYVDQFSSGAHLPISGSFAQNERVWDTDKLLRDVLMRAMPEAATKAAASPITPPAPPAETTTAAVAQGVAAAVLKASDAAMPEAGLIVPAG
jgi:hypothetical protein